MTAIDIIVKQDIAMIGYNSTTNLEIPAFEIDGLEGSNTKHTASITDVYLATESSVSKETASLEPDMTNDSVHMDQTSIFNTDGSIRESIGKITTAEEVSIFQLGLTSESLFETKIQESDLSLDRIFYDNSTAENVTHKIHLLFSNIKSNVTNKKGKDIAFIEIYPKEGISNTTSEQELLDL